MRVLRRYSRLTFALWLALLALAAGGIEQNQLATTVIQTAFVEAGQGDLHGVSGGHIMPDGRFMAGPMGGKDAGGHTHKGHIDCEVCGALAAMAAFTLPSPVGIAPPQSFALPDHFSAAPVLLVPRVAPVYASRAPPMMV